VCAKRRSGWAATVPVRKDYEFEPAIASGNLAVLSRQCLTNRVVSAVMYMNRSSWLSRSYCCGPAHELIPAGSAHNLGLRKRVCIRSQLLNHMKERLQKDLLCLQGVASTHVLNAISAAKTASFESAGLILGQSVLT